MRTVSVRLVDLQKAVIPIGFVGENQHTQVRIDSLKLYDEYPNAAASLTVKPPTGEPYPAVVVRDGNTVVWEVTDSDLIYAGNGEIQLAFSVDEVVAKSYVGKIRISRSIMPTGEIPDPLDDFLVRAGAVLTAIPETIDTALQEAKDSGEFDGKDGHSPVVTASKVGHVTTIYVDGEPIVTINDGQDGISPSAAVSKAGDTATITITDRNGTTTATVKDGTDGKPGEPGQPGVSPAVSVAPVTGGHTVTITDATGAHSFDVMDGEKGDPGDPMELIDDTTTALDKVWSSRKTDEELSDVKSAINALDADKYEKPVGGIPASDLASGVIPSVPVQDVQINGTSILENGVANVPSASSDAAGVVRTSGNLGTSVLNGILFLSKATDANVKSGSNQYQPIVPYNQHTSVFYALAKLAGADMASSSNPVGTFTEAAKSAISTMLNGAVSVSGTTPSITAKAGVRYICGEVSTLSITAPTSGCIDVVFTSGSTPTVLTVSSAKANTTIKWANGFDPTSLDANTTYEVNILDGEFGVVGSWT